MKEYRHAIAILTILAFGVVGLYVILFDWPRWLLASCAITMIGAVVLQGIWTLDAVNEMNRKTR